MTYRAPLGTLVRTKGTTADKPDQSPCPGAVEITRQSQGGEDWVGAVILSGNVEQILGGDEQHTWIFEGKAFQVEGTARAKALKRDHA